MTEKKALHILLADDSNDYGDIPQMTICLANAMIARGHKVTIFNQEPVQKRRYKLYKLGYFLKCLSFPKDQQPFPAKGIHSINELYSLHYLTRIEYYNFSDDNFKVQALRQRIKALNPDVCLPMFGDARQLVWAVTLLGSGVPYLYSEMCTGHVQERDFTKHHGRLAAMSGADRIHFTHDKDIQDLPDFLQENVRIMPNPVPSIEVDTKETQEPLLSSSLLDNWESLFQETAACKGNTLMDAFTEEPFASMARLSSAAQREWLYRDFGKPVPNSIEARLLDFLNALVPPSVK